MIEDFRILYINSFQRSGSTILGTLLGQLSDVSYLGEVRNLQDYYLNNKHCFCSHTIKKCSFWGPILQDVGEEHTVLTKSTYGIAHRCVKLLSLSELSLSIVKRISPRISDISEEFEVIRNIKRIYNATYAIEKRPVICDSSHRTTQCRLLYDLYGERLKVISLVRDGRAVVNSVRRRTGCSLEHAARRWVRFHQFQKLSYRSIPQYCRIFIRYEDLCADPKTEIKRVRELAAISGKETDDALHFIGGSSTIRDNKFSISTISLDEKWRHELTAQDLMVFEKIAGKWNRYFGYD